MRHRPVRYAVLLLAVAAPCAAAAPPTLHDVTLQVFWNPDSEGRTTGPCVKDEPSTLRFVVEGSPDGTGGTVRIREEGTVRIGPHSLPAIPEDETHWNGTYFLNAAPVIEWQSQFTIDATSYNGTTVSGTRTGSEAAPYDVGLCREFAGTADADAGHNNTFGYRHYARSIRLRYEARLTRDGQTVTETGTSEVNLREAFLQGDPGARVGQYRTTFAATGEPPVAEPSGVPEGATVTTDEEPSGAGPGGDGATQADPIEVTVDDGAATDTAVAELATTSSRAVAAASRLRLLSQRVRIRAPARAAPVRVAFEIDSTARRSAGPRRIVVRRNGRTVRRCGSGASPCVERRSASGGDDARIVVRGRAVAGRWTFLAPRGR